MTFFQFATELDNRFLLFSFFQLIDTDTRINQADKNLHTLVKELNATMSVKVRFTARNQLIIEPSFIFFVFFFNYYILLLLFHSSVNDTDTRLDRKPDTLQIC